MSKDFPGPSAHKLKRISSSWRRPRGMHHKVRLCKKGHFVRVRIGYHRQQKEQTPIMVCSAIDLKKAESMKAKKVIFNSMIGTKKRIEMMKLAAQLGIEVVNVSKDFVSNAEKAFKERKQAKAEAQKKEQKDTKSQPAQPKPKEKKEEQKLTDEEKKEQEKKEKDKVLIRKDGI